MGVGVVRELCQGGTLPAETSAPRQVEYRPADEYDEQTYRYRRCEKRTFHDFLIAFAFESADFGTYLGFFLSQSKMRSTPFW